MSFKEFISEARKIQIKNDKDFLKALYDLEANSPTKAKKYLTKAAEYFEDKGLDYTFHEYFEDGLGELPSKFMQQPLVDALIDYVEENL